VGGQLSVDNEYDEKKDYGLKLLELEELRKQNKELVETLESFSATIKNTHVEAEVVQGEAEKAKRDRDDIKKDLEVSRLEIKK
jgi:uncharacterized protein (DUF3084 family)